MKVRGYLKGSGKLGNIVCSTVAGETIARDYNPEVANPNTETQVAQRAKFKLMSQLSSVMATVIAIPKEKSQSSRNLFVRKNMSVTVFDGVQATINLNRVQLTNGNTNIETFGCDRSSHNTCSCYYSGVQLVGMVGMVYCIFTKDDAGNLSLFDSAVVTENTESGDWGADLKYTGAEIVLYAYALIGDRDKAKAAFGNLEAKTAESIAKLMVTSSVEASTIKTTKTKGFTMPVGIEDGEWSEDDGKVRLSITITGPGTANGAGRYDIGERVRCTATPNQGMEFVGWYRGGQQVATSLNYEFDIVADTTIEARFKSPAARHNVSATVSPNGSGTVSGTGSYEEGSNCTVVASPASGYRFKEWQKNGAQVSTSASYTFAVMEDVALVAVFEQATAQFSDVTLDGKPWDRNHSGEDTANIAGKYEGAATKVIVCKGNEPHTEGSTFTPQASEISVQSAKIVSGSFIIPQFNLEANSSNYLLACTVSGDNWTIETVYPYRVDGPIG